MSHYLGLPMKNETVIQKCMGYGPMENVQVCYTIEYEMEMFRVAKW